MSGLRFSRVFPSVVWQIPGYKSQRRALPALYPLGYIFYAVSSSLILVWPLWVQIPEGLPTKVVNCVVLCIVCVCVLYYCHRVSIQLQLNISYHISYHITSYIIYITYTYHKSDDNACVFLRQQGNYSPRVCPWGTNCHWKWVFWNAYGRGFVVSGPSTQHQAVGFFFTTMHRFTGQLLYKNF